MTIDEFKDELKKHDWTYSFSDDGRVFDKGHYNEKRLAGIADGSSDEFKKAFNDAYAKIFHKEPFVKPWNFPFNVPPTKID